MSDKNNTLIMVLIVILGLGGLMWWGLSRQQPPGQGGGAHGGKSSLVVSETFYDFGTISMANGMVNRVFKITNPTNEDITIKTITTSCMCTNAFIESASGEKGPFGMEGMGYVPPADEAVKAGESRDIKVVFDPNAHGPAGIGLIDRLVYITEESGSKLQLEIKAVVTP